jgi:hypothetical protein
LNTRLANFLSVALHPLLMPTFLFLILFFLAPTATGAESLGLMFKLAFLGFTFFYTFVLPAYFIYLLHRWGIIGSMKLENLRDRRIPYFLTAAIYTILGYIIYSKNSMLFPCAYILWSITALIFFVAIISLWWQISAHAAGIGGMIGALAGIFVQMGESELFIPMLCFIFLSGLLISARLKLNAHTPAQVGAGFLLGIVLSLTSVYWFF